jgi:hypothetical protein
MSEPTITSKSLPPSMQPSAVKSSPPVVPPTPPGLTPSVEIQIPYEQIEAKPLRSPNFLNLKPKNPNMSLFFGNRSVGEKESGLRYDQLIAMGFVPAKPEDVITNLGQPCPPSLVRDGRIMYGDLILLKMPRADYVGNQKWNEQNARLRMRKPGVTLEGGSAEHQAADGRLQPQAALNIPAALKNKIGLYVPDITEVDAATKDNR